MFRCVAVVLLASLLCRVDSQDFCVQGVGSGYLHSRVPELRTGTMLRAVAVLFLASLLCRVESEAPHLCQSPTSRPQENVFPGNQTAPYNVLVVEDDNACHNPGPLEVNVTWRRPQVKSPIKAYKIHVISVSGSDNTVNLPGDVTSHVVDSMECWNAYILRVEAVFESGQSAFSNATFHVTGNRTLRYFPQDLRAVEGDKKCHGHAENTSVVLHWKPAILGHNFTVMGYQVEIYFVNGTTKAFDLPSTAAEFEYENVPCNGTTVFGVSAVLLLNAAFPHGTEGLFIYPAAYVAVSYGRYELPLVQNLRARVQGATSIKVQWTPPAEGAVEYRVSAEAVHAPPLVVFTNDTSVTFRHLTPGKEYTIRVATANTVNGKTSYGTYVEVNATTNVLLNRW
ncbi:uncharacterized protein LOC119403075 [Rhipicephalus sanguineus]|uniref:uncharacterized protein LOC119403075 n=1 Tax=Rhipicephalus sanguineus TaxID=34632 RepID=UPI0020C3296A|nr:uncharacterized protein LOC119403075 [Rhipicephalus sanguineus]